MSEQIAYLEAIVGADITSFRQSMRTVRSDIGGLGKVMDGLAKAGRNMTFAVTAPLALLGGAAVKAASSFDASMRNINSIAHLTEEQLKALTQQTLEFGSTTRSGPQKVAEALYEVYSAGKVGAEAFEIMAVSVKTAEAGLADLSKTTNAITATVTAFSNVGLKATEASNIWTRMVAVGVGELDEFLANSQKVLPTAAAMGISFQNIGQSAAFISQQGGGARKAMTGLGMLMSNLVKPNETLAEAYKKLGVVTGVELIQKFGTLEDSLMAIRGVTDDKTWFKSFSKTGMEAALAITNNFDKFKASVEEFNDGLGDATQKAWEQQMMSFAAQWDMMKSAVSSLAIVIGNALMPVILPVINFIKEIALHLSRTNPQLLQLAATIGVVVAAIGPLLWIMGSILNPITLIVTAITALSTAWATNWGNIRSTVEGIVTQVLGPLDEIRAGVDEFWKTLFPEDKGADTATGPVKTISQTIGMSITIKKGDTIWDIWNNQFKDQFPDWPTFRDMVYENNPGIKQSLMPGQEIVIPVPTKLDLQMSGGAGDGSKFLMKNLGEDYNSSPEIDGFWDRLGQALAGGWTKIQPGLQTAFDNLKSWITTTAIPGLDTIAGAGIDKLAAVFVPLGTTSEGDSPIYEGIRGMLNGGISKAFSEFGNFFSENFPKLSEALGEFFANIGAWLLNEGLPTLFRTLGYVGATIVLKLGEAIRTAISSIGDFISGGGIGDTTTVLGTAVVDPFMQGMQEAINDARFDENGIAAPLGETIANAIVGIFGTAAVIGILTVGFGGTISTALLGVKLLGFGVLHIASSIVGGLMSALAASTVGQMIMAKIIGSAAAAKLSSSAGLKLAETIITPLDDVIIPDGKLKGFVGKIGDGLSAAFGLVKSGATWVKNIAVSIAGSIAGAISVGGIFSAITGGLMTAFGGLTAATSWIVTAAGGLATAIAGAIATVPILLPALTVGLAAGAIIVLLGDIGGEISRVLTGTDQLKAREDQIRQVKSLTQENLLATGGKSAWGKWRKGLTEEQQAFRIELGSQIKETKAFISNLTLGQAGSLIRPFLEGMQSTEVSVGPANPAEAMAESIQKIQDMSPVEGLTSGMAQAIVATLGEQSEAMAAWRFFVDTVVADVDKLVLIFGEEGMLRMSWNDLILAVSQGVLTIGTELTNLLVGSTTKFVALNVLLGITKTIWHNMMFAMAHDAEILADAINMLAGAASHLVTAIYALNAIHLDLSGLDTVMGGGPLPGFASGGTLQGWGMVGENGPEPVYFGSKGTILPTHVLRDAGGSRGASGGNSVTIQTTDVDQILFELRRRGIYL